MIKHCKTSSHLFNKDQRVPSVIGPPSSSDFERNVGCERVVLGVYRCTEIQKVPSCIITYTSLVLCCKRIERGRPILCEFAHKYAAEVVQSDFQALSDMQTASGICTYSEASSCESSLTAKPVIALSLACLFPLFPGKDTAVCFLLDSKFHFFQD